MINNFLSQITNKQIFETCHLLGLPRHAFHGLDGNDPRLRVLLSQQTIDIEACPGSGKTTLLIAKLNLLAKQWKYRSRGICVLSHTNAAREEIIKRLSLMPGGRSLLGPPHYVGTIHSFVNEFIAIPWLRSLGYSTNIVDDDTTLNWRFRSLPEHIKNAIQRNPQHKENPQNCLRIENTNFEVAEICTGRGQFIRSGDPSFTAITTICQKSYLKGLMCFNEIFLWANEALSKQSSIHRAIRDRFPLLFIDEVQDTSEIQSAILHRIFMKGNSPSIRQRFGDSNQAIYNYSGQSGATTDPFPSELPDVKIEIPNSHRFGSEIASLASAFAISPFTTKLKGVGPSADIGSVNTDKKHTIFLFQEDNIENVLIEYAKHIDETFKNDANFLRHGDFVAVGAVHTKPRNPKPPPHHVGHYLPEYSSEILRNESSPRTLSEFIFQGQILSSQASSSNVLVEKYSEGMLKAAQLAGWSSTASRRGNKHRLILEQLSKHPCAKEKYEAQIIKLITENVTLNKHAWEESWIGDVHTILESLVDSDLRIDKALEFLSWPTSLFEPAVINERRRIENRFFYPNKENPEFSIRLGSIHSVKGQNHTSTLVLETFHRTLHLKKIKEWILGKNRTQNQIDKQSDRLKLHYVAMTRPTHLLCLAMRQDSFTSKEIETLKTKTRWAVKIV